MGKKTDDRSAGCPYFSKKMKACELSTEGIYLPPSVHVLTYCQTDLYEECSVYTRYVPLANEGSNQAAQKNGNRRTYRRIPEQKKVLIRTCSPEGVVVGDFSEMAVTRDYSPKGMRITINREIPAESLLLFDFDMDFLVPRLQGLAQLRWHKTLEQGSGVVEAGLAFKDQYSQKALVLAMEEHPQ
jgi:hypothetical protein